jgi:hypothetical protein
VNIVIVAHKFLTQSDDELVECLNNNKFNNLLHIMYSFSDAPDRRSYFRIYKSGNLVKELTGRDFKNFPEPFNLFKRSFYDRILCW